MGSLQPDDLLSEAQVFVGTLVSDDSPDGIGDLRSLLLTVASAAVSAHDECRYADVAKLSREYVAVRDRIVALLDSSETDIRDILKI